MTRVSGLSSAPRTTRWMCGFVGGSSDRERPNPASSRCRAPFLLDQVAGKGAEVLHLGRIFGTDDEPEVMPVIPGALGAVAQIRLARRRVETSGRPRRPWLRPRASDTRDVPEPRRRRGSPVGRRGPLRSPGAQDCRIVVAPRCARRPLRRDLAPIGYGWLGTATASSGRMACTLRRGEDLHDEQLRQPLPGSF
jgi:hypothetical protein